MSQMSLFTSQASEPARRPPDLAFIRKRLNYLLRLACNAERMPWGAGEAASWERRFPLLAAYLPEDEGKPLCEAFAEELARLREVA